MSQEREIQLWHQFEQALGKVVTGEPVNENDRLVIQAYRLRGEARYYPVRRAMISLSHAYQVVSRARGHSTESSATAVRQDVQAPCQDRRIPAVGEASRIHPCGNHEQRYAALREDQMQSGYQLPPTHTPCQEKPAQDRQSDHCCAQPPVATVRFLAPFARFAAAVRRSFSLPRK